MTDRVMLEIVLERLKNVSRFDIYYYDREFGMSKEYRSDGDYCNHYEIEDIQESVEKYLNKS